MILDEINTMDERDLEGIVACYKTRSPIPEDNYTQLMINAMTLAAWDYLDLKTIVYGVQEKKINIKTGWFRKLAYNYTADDEIVRCVGRRENKHNKLSYEEVLDLCVKHIGIIRSYLLEDPYQIFVDRSPTKLVESLDSDFEENKDKYLDEILTNKKHERYFVM